MTTVTTKKTNGISGWNIIFAAVLKRFNHNLNSVAAALSTPLATVQAWGLGRQKPTPRAVQAMRRQLAR